MSFIRCMIGSQYNSEILMQALKRITTAAMHMKLAYRPAAMFSDNKWKERDEAAEKVYISRN